MVKQQSNALSGLHIRKLGKDQFTCSKLKAANFIEVAIHVILSNYLFICFLQGKPHTL